MLRVYPDLDLDLDLDLIGPTVQAFFSVWFWSSGPSGTSLLA